MVNAIFYLILGVWQNSTEFIEVTLHRQASMFVAEHVMEVVA
jgi:hypothetical protein